MSNGGSQQQQSSAPWSGQQPYLHDLFAESQAQFNQGPQSYYPGPTVAPFSPQSSMGLDMLTQQAMGGSPQQDAFGNYLSNQLGMSNVNPYDIYSSAYGAARGIPEGMNLMSAAGQPNALVGGAATGLADASAFRGLGDAFDAAGQPVIGALPASNEYVTRMLGEQPDFGALSSQILGQLPPGVSPEAANQLTNTAKGGYLGSNPYLNDLFDTAASRAGEQFNEQVLPGIAHQFGAAGRTGSGIHQDVVENASRQFGRDLQGMAADIYAPAYESERGRQIDAAGTLGGLGVQTGQLGLGGLNLAGDLFQGAEQRQLGAAGLGGDLFSRYNTADLGRGDLASRLYLGERGLGQEALSTLGDLGLGSGNLGLQAGTQLGQLGLGGIDAMSNLYGNIAQNQFRAGSLMPSYQNMQYGNIDQMLRAGGMIEDQAQRYMDANQAQWNFGQQAPWENLNNYANLIYGLPGGYGTQTSTQPGGSRLSGIAGGALTGLATGNPWLGLGGAVLGGIL